MLRIPASANWNGKLALLGLDAKRSADDVQALSERGYAVGRFGGTPDSLRATLSAAGAQCIRLHGRAPQYILVLCDAPSAHAALRLAVESPDSFNGLIAAGLPDALDEQSTNLAAFAAAGGRIIVFHDPANPSASLAGALRFYQGVERRAGSLPAAAAYARLYLLPNCLESGAGSGAWRTDWLLLAEKWLEQTPPRPPDDPVLWQPNPGVLTADGLFAPALIDPPLVAASRPAYPYPLRAIYKGRGEHRDWRSWYAPSVYRRDNQPPRVDELPKPIEQPPRASLPLRVDTRIGPVAVIGATGRLGLEIVRALQHHGVAVRAIARDARKAAARLPRNTESAIADVRDAAAVEQALRGTRRVVFAASATAGGSGANTPRAVEYEGVRAVAHAARALGLDQVLLVSSAACTQSEHIHNLWGDILVWKYRSEQLLRSSGARYTILRPTGLRASPGGQRGIRFVQGDRIALGEEISRADVASLCVALLSDPAGLSKTFEAYNDDTLVPDGWVGTFDSIRPDIPPQADFDRNTVI
jgi:uncharacterized protein YbjT (DUF2867 family)